MADAITPRRGGGGAMPHLDDGIVSEILDRLPSEDAYRVAAVCLQWRPLLDQPTFLRRHLSPPPLLDDRPYALIIQPRRKVGYFTHLTLIAFDHADPVPVNIPLQPKYKESETEHCLLDTANDDSMFSLLYSTGADDSASINAVEDTEPLAYAPGGAVSSYQVTWTVDVSEVEEGAPASPLRERVEDYIIFFERTIPVLGISIVASHGRLLLCQSRSPYYVCDPSANRWIELPLSTIAPVSVTNSGFHYDRASNGTLTFTVVLLVRRRRQRVLVDTFSSTTGRWEARELAASGAARCLGATSPGVHVGTCFNWLSRRHGRILRYDITRGRVSVICEPAEPVWSKGRVGRSLGSVGSKLRRLCSVDIRVTYTGLTSRRTEGVLGVWVMDIGAPVASARPQWHRVHGTVAWGKWMLDGINRLSEDKHEKPVDFAGACDEFIMVDYMCGVLLRHDLDSGGKKCLAFLERGGGLLPALYRRYHAFPFFE